MFPELTVREREVALLIVRGWSNHEIAVGLMMSVKTYDAHRSRIMRKMAARNNVDLCLMAVRRGYLQEFLEAA